MIKRLLRQIVVFLRKKIIRTLCNFRSVSRVFKSKFAETKRARLDFTELFVQHAVGICMHAVRSYFTETVLSQATQLQEALQAIECQRGLLATL